MSSSRSAPRSPCRATPPAPSEAGRQGAFQEGRELYAAGDYGGALAEYEVAYRLLRLPDLLFNIGQAHRANQEPRAALDFYRQYLAAEPDGPAAEEARLHVAELTRDLRAEEVATTTGNEGKTRSPRTKMPAIFAAHGAPILKPY